VRAHERFCAPLLDDIPAPSVLIQPEDRGSATAVFYGALRLLSLSVDAPVAIFPSDHYVADDRAFMAHVNVAVDVVRARPDLLVLVGIAPDTDEVEYQWIEPADVIRGPGLALCSRCAISGRSRRESSPRRCYARVAACGTASSWSPAPLRCSP
jgi:mannose-1-phosphate guanylyltransferase